MRRARSISLIVFCLLAGIQLQAASSKKALEKRVGAILGQPDLTRGFWGIEVVSLQNGKVRYSQNADKLFTPASNTMLFTTAAALALIGPNYNFRTTVETSGTLDKHGRLTGDLVLVGRGDPNLSGRELPYALHTARNEHPIQVLEQLADELVKKGVKYVDGDIVADDSYFAFERYGEGWSQDDLVWDYGAPVSALTINDNVVFVNILPGDRVGERAFVSITPFADYYRALACVLLAIVGVAAGVRLWPDAERVVSGFGKSPLMAVISVKLLFLLTVGAHQLVHGLALIHYGRRVREFGFTFLHGFVPTFYVDVTDIFMGSRRARRVTPVSGALVHLVFGSAWLLIALHAPMGSFLQAFAAPSGIIQWKR